jgi:hypothetical protein
MRWDSGGAEGGEGTLQVKYSSLVGLLSGCGTQHTETIVAVLPATGPTAPSWSSCSKLAGHGNVSRRSIPMTAPCHHIQWMRRSAALVETLLQAAVVAVLQRERLPCRTQQRRAWAARSQSVQLQCLSHTKDGWSGTHRDGLHLSQVGKKGALVLAGSRGQARDVHVVDDVDVLVATAHRSTEFCDIADDRQAFAR